MKRIGAIRACLLSNSPGFFSQSSEAISAGLLASARPLLLACCLSTSTSQTWSPWRLRRCPESLENPQNRRSWPPGARLSGPPPPKCASSRCRRDREPGLQILRRYRRSLLLRLEQAHRSALEDHVRRTPRLGQRGLLNVRIGRLLSSRLRLTKTLTARRI